MTTLTINNFVAETNGRCFLCSNKVDFQTLGSGDSDSSSMSNSIYSLHCLSRYLRMDLKKVFSGEGPVPPHLVERVEKSKLVTQLCADCGVLTERFSKLFRQLEKIEMELKCCLNFVHGKLGSARGIENDDNNSDDELIAKLEITEALRKDAMQKCSRKLDMLLPLAKLQRLTGKQVMARKLNLKSNFGMAAGNIDGGGSTKHFESNYEDQEDYGSPDSVPARNDYQRDYLDEQSATVMVKQEGIEDAGGEHPEETSHELEMTLILVSEGNQQSARTGHRDQSDYKAHQQSKTRMYTTTEISELSQAIPAPIKIVGETGKRPVAFKNPETGKFKCPVCYREYARFQGYHFHYTSAHFKVRHKCTACEMEFSFKQSYETHYLNVHMGVRFKCGKCYKTFSTKGDLAKHQKRRRCNC